MNIDLEIVKLTRDMAMDERDLFLSIYGDLEAKARQAALKKTRTALLQQRQEKAEAARKRLPEIAAELEQLNQMYAEFMKTRGDGGLLPEHIGRNRNRFETLVTERGRLQQMIKELEQVTA